MLKLKQPNKCDTSEMNSSPNGILMSSYAYTHSCTCTVYRCTLYMSHSKFPSIQVSISVWGVVLLCYYYLAASNKFSRDIDLRFHFRLFLWYDNHNTVMLLNANGLWHAKQLAYFPLWYHLRNLAAAVVLLITTDFPFVTLIKWQIFCLCMTCDVII